MRLNYLVRSLLNFTLIACEAKIRQIKRHQRGTSLKNPHMSFSWYCLKYRTFSTWLEENRAFPNHSDVLEISLFASLAYLTGLPKSQMRAITLLILVLCLKGAIARSEGEKTAISDLLLSIPDLGHLSPPWVSNASEACGIRPFKGILCSEGLDQHVVSMYGPT